MPLSGAVAAPLPKCVRGAADRQSPLPDDEKPKNLRQGDRPSLLGLQEGQQSCLAQSGVLVKDVSLWCTSTVASKNQ